MSKIKQGRIWTSLCMPHIFVALLIWVIAFGSACAGSKVNPKYDVQHLFTLDSLEASDSYSRPTPTIAVNSLGEIAFPLRKYEIGIFSQDGGLKSVIRDSANSFPKELLFDDKDILQALSYDEDSIVKYAEGERLVYPLIKLEDWWSHSDQRIKRFLSAHKTTPFAIEDKGALGTFLQFPYFLEIMSTDSFVFVSGEELTLHDIGQNSSKVLDIEPQGLLIGILDSDNLLFRTTFDAAIYGVTDHNSLEINLKDVVIEDTLPTGFFGNFPESNKRNLATNWYWQRNTLFLYKVSQLPTGYYFFKITFELESN